MNTSCNNVPQGERRCVTCQKTAAKETIFFVRHFSRLSAIILDEDRNRLAKRCQVAGYVFQRLINIQKIRLN